MVVTE
jgi:hypothetical protein